MNTLAILAILSAGPVPPTDSTGLAMLGVKGSHGVKPSLAQLLDEALLVSLKTSGVFSSVLGASDIAQMLDLEEQKSITGCDEDSCLAEAGGALGVPFLGSCTVGKLGTRYLVTFKVIRSDEAKVVSRAMRQVDDEGGLVDAVTALVNEVSKDVKGAIEEEREGSELGQDNVSRRSKSSLAKMSLGIAGLGALLSGIGAYVQMDAQWTFDLAKSDGVTLGEVDEIEGDFQMGHRLVGGGAGLLVLGLLGGLFL